MLVRIGCLFMFIGGLVLSFYYSLFIVGPDQYAVVLRGDDVARICGKGLHMSVPLLETRKIHRRGQTVWTTEKKVRTRDDVELEIFVDAEWRIWDLDQFLPVYKKALQKGERPGQEVNARIREIEKEVFRSWQLKDVTDDPDFSFRSQQKYVRKEINDEVRTRADLELKGLGVRMIEVRLRVHPS